VRFRVSDMRARRNDDFHAPIGAASSFATASKGKSQLCRQQYARAHQNDAERVVGWNFEHGVRLPKRTPSAELTRLGPRGALGYAIQRATPGSESIQSAVTLSSFEIKVTGSRDLSIAAVHQLGQLGYVGRYPLGKRKSPGRADRGFNFLEGARHGGLGEGWHPPSSALILIQRKPSQAVPRGSGIFSPSAATREQIRSLVLIFNSNRFNGGRHSGPANRRMNSAGAASHFQNHNMDQAIAPGLFIFIGGYFNDAGRRIRHQVTTEMETRWQRLDLATRSSPHGSRNTGSSIPRYVAIAEVGWPYQRHARPASLRVAPSRHEPRGRLW
jgi:hypothetical protein